jgi:glucose/arabinose dehydrogenase
MRCRVVCLVAVCAAAGFVERAQAGGELATTRVAFGLNRPTDAVAAPGDPTRLFIVEQPGLIKILDLTTGDMILVPFLNISARVSNDFFGNAERGLFSLAFHPNYFVKGDPNEGAFFVHYSANNGSTTIERYRVSDNPNVADPNSNELVLSVPQPFANHNGGTIVFGPRDGYLYIGLGDGGFANDPGNRGQDITNQLLAKILRIDVDGADDFPTNPNKNYAIPPSNPFVDVVGDDEIWAWGIRNPWRMSFDRLTHDFYISDVGQNAREEVNVQSPDSPGGENYGWRCMEGNACTGLSGCVCNAPDLVDPVLEYSPVLGRSITGGYVYRGCEIPEIFGHYIYGDFVTGRIWSFKLVNGVATERQERTSDLGPPDAGGVINQISSFAEDAAGNIYIVDRGSGNSSSQGQVFRITRETPLVPSGDAPVIVHDGNGNGDALFSGYIDPRIESDNGVDVNQGIDEFVIEFSKPVVNADCTLIGAGSFSAESTGAVVPQVVSVDSSANPTVKVKLASPIAIQEWTTLIASVEDFEQNAIQSSGDMGPGVIETDRIDIGFLPGDVNQDAQVSPLDLFRFRQIINDVFVPPFGSVELFVDADRSGSVTPLDLFRFRQMVNGVSPATRPWSEAPNNVMLSDQP